MMWGYGGHWLLGMAMMLLMWGTLVAIVYLALRAPDDEHRPTPRERLDERMASGQLSDEEYARKRALLDGSTPIGDR